MDRRILLALSMLANIAAAAVSCAEGDYFWLFVLGLTAASICGPYMLKLKAVPGKQLIALSIIIPAARVAFYLSGLGHDSAFWGVPLWMYASSLCMSALCYADGLSIFAIANSYGKISVGRGWTSLFAVTVSLGASAAYIIFIFFRLYFDGYPVGAEGKLPDAYGVQVEGLIMNFPTIASVSGFVFAAITYYVMKKTGRKSLTEGL